MTEDGIISYRLEQLEKSLKKLSEEVEIIERRNQERDRERSEAERKQLIAGISFLGSMVMLLIGIIWSYRNIILGTPQ